MILTICPPVFAVRIYPDDAYSFNVDTGSLI